MIPKIIHYCWFGGKPLNKLGRKCLKSWKRFFPDYEIKEWNESNFDVNACKYVSEAYREKKWAFVSDYARYYILHEYGGVYFDTDVQVVRGMQDILDKGAFMGAENPDLSRPLEVNPGLGFAMPKGHAFAREMLERYHQSSFYNADGSLNLYTIVERSTDLLKEKGLQQTGEVQCVADITVYPTEYFCPIRMDTGKMQKTKNTRSIHRYAASWVDKKSRFRGKVYRLIARVFGRRAAEFTRKILGRK